LIFNSVTYLIFLTVATILYWVLPNRARLYMLFMASVSFYGFWRWDFVPVMLFSAMVDYFVSLAMQKEQEHRKILLSISLLTNLGLLFYFKYLVFFVENPSSTSGAILSAKTTLRKSPASILLIPIAMLSEVNCGRFCSCGITSPARNIGPATNCGKNIT